MKIVVASGKGGVGKSMLASSLALLFAREARVVACDCDVDAPNLALWLGIKKMKHAKKISTGEKAFIDYEKCTRCGRCSEVCKFDAISKDIEVIQFFCEGCGACSVVCPVDAIRLKPVQGGEINVEKREFPIVSGQLYPGESGSGKIVSEVRKRAEGFKYDVMVIDSAAGIGCWCCCKQVGYEQGVFKENQGMGFQKISWIYTPQHVGCRRHSEDEACFGD
jgi:MinD superfamily P-loop ATPase